MGIYDRDYERGYGNQPWRPEGEGIQLRAPQSVVGRIILITVVAYLIQLAAGPWFGDLFGLSACWFKEPWRVFELVSYGFLHSRDSILHIAFNMYGLWIFGSELERRFGQREFLLFYLLAIVAGGLAFTLGGYFSGDWALPIDAPAGQPRASSVIGASGGVVAITILFAIFYPHRKILFMFVFPMPMWVLGCIMVGNDVLNAVGAGGENLVASSAHLGGAAFAFLYYKQQWRVSEWFPKSLAMPSFKRKPKLRVLHEDDDEPAADPAERKLEEQLDRVLAKIKAEGQDSLTRQEKKILEQASRRAQKRQR